MPPLIFTPVGTQSEAHNLGSDPPGSMSSSGQEGSWKDWKGERNSPFRSTGKTNIFLPWHRETWTTLPCGHKDCFRYISYWKGFYGLAWEPTTTYVLVRNTFTEQCELFMWQTAPRLGPKNNIYLLRFLLTSYSFNQISHVR